MAPLHEHCCHQPSLHDDPLSFSGDCVTLAQPHRLLDVGTSRGAREQTAPEVSSYISLTAVDSAL